MIRNLLQECPSTVSKDDSLVFYDSSQAPEFPISPISCGTPTRMDKKIPMLRRSSLYFPDSGTKGKNLTEMAPKRPRFTSHPTMTALTPKIRKLSNRGVTEFESHSCKKIGSFSMKRYDKEDFTQGFKMLISE